MNLLGIDTSSTSTVLGLLQGDTVIDRTVRDVRTHSREILPAIADLLANAKLALGDIDAIVFGQGPGSFTGLRIAVGVVQGLAYGAGLAVVPVSSMAVLAQASKSHDGPVFVALSARLEEVYYGCYQLENGFAVASVLEGVRDVSELEAVSTGDWQLITDIPILQEKIATSLGVQFSSVSTDTLPRVDHLLALGKHRLEAGYSVSALDASPVYLREQVANP